MMRALLFACLLPTVASAASFDCDKVRSPLEKAVCADPELSALDSKIANTYNAARQRLSPEGNKILRDGQRQWLHFVGDLCFAPRNAQEIGICLNSEYAARLKQLSTAAISIGPYLFSRSDSFSAKTHDDDGQVYKLKSSAPRIDAPLSVAAVEWNSMVAKRVTNAMKSGCDAGHGDEQLDAEVTYATANTVSIKTTSWEDCHGTAHGNGSTVSLTYMLAPKLHALEAADLFDMDTSWKDFLTQRSYEALEKKAGGTRILRSNVEQAVVNVLGWTLTQDGLLITIDPYAVLAYAYGTTKVSIAWSDLKPFLAHNAPVPPQT
ncbi:DUF3298 domain-containing protein [Pseudomonas vanderleydeniana]|uniref:DUF3298 domain-containing protein n=1 Tax=Pseudomonas vanderleydeniana TaxID=2745495 RepID=A0A9E6PGT9_9PSED|nr:DUF3298 domain-containing protein [Pseudomonas vanderleydeniana]QXI26208.1 DUF3298 domain-containing protein [Pseudomonas vanderleydeniana]